MYSVFCEEFVFNLDLSPAIIDYLNKLRSNSVLEQIELQLVNSSFVKRNSKMKMLKMRKLKREKSLLNSDCSLREKFDIGEAAHILSVLGDSNELDIVPPKYLRRKIIPKIVDPKESISPKLPLNLINVFGKHIEQLLHYFVNNCKQSLFINDNEQNSGDRINSIITVIRQRIQTFSEILALVFSTEFEKSINEIGFTEDEALNLLYFISDHLLRK